jgi:hypothetical protein
MVFVVWKVVCWMGQMHARNLHLDISLLMYSHKGLVGGGGVKLCLPYAPSLARFRLCTKALQ